MLAVLSGVAGWTLTGVTVDAIHASGTVLTLMASAVVDVLLAIWTGKACKKNYDKRNLESVGKLNKN